ncbi:hypothetical protein GCM10023338_15670 [Wohlfahrtiimonas larvae]|uniref:Uncharacterized protein n=1 Tax=Wohlfahrtiimonas larvae TaxID=1157986 RepID=A0ABP9MUK1_9GAMM
MRLNVNILEYILFKNSTNLFLSDYILHYYKCSYINRFGIVELSETQPTNSPSVPYKSSKAR